MLVDDFALPAMGGARSHTSAATARRNTMEAEAAAGLHTTLSDDEFNDLFGDILHTPVVPAPPRSPAPASGRHGGRVQGHTPLLHANVQWTAVHATAAECRAALETAQRDGGEGAMKAVAPLLRLQKEETVRRLATVEAPYWHACDELADASRQLTLRFHGLRVRELSADEQFERRAIAADAANALLRLVEAASDAAATERVDSLERAERQRLTTLECSGRLALVPMGERAERRAIEAAERTSFARFGNAMGGALRIANLKAMERIGREWWVTQAAQKFADVAVLHRYERGAVVLAHDEAYRRFAHREHEDAERAELELAFVSETALAGGSDQFRRPFRAAATIVAFFRRLVARRAARKQCQERVEEETRDATAAMFAELGLGDD